MKERNVASEKTERKELFFDQIKKGPDNLSMCCNVSGES